MQPLTVSGLSSSDRGAYLCAVFRKNPTKRPPGVNLVAAHERWAETIAQSPHRDEPQGIVLASAAAGATVALGAFGTVVEELSRGKAKTISGINAELDDHIVAFGHAIRGPIPAEAAWRVVVWTLVAEQAVFYWRPNYDIEMDVVASVFGADSIYEQTVIEYGRPVASHASDDERSGRLYRWMQTSLYGVVSAALDRPVEPAGTTATIRATRESLCGVSRRHSFHSIWPLASYGTTPFDKRHRPASQEPP